MEAIVAIGLAGNVIQFLDFMGKIIRKARSIRREGSVVEFTDLRAVHSQLQGCASELKSSLKASGTPMSNHEKSLCDLCESCLKVAKQLGNALERLEIKGEMRKWKSVRQALKAVLGKDELLELKARLDQYAELMDRRILWDMKSKIDISTLASQSRFDTLNTATQNVISRLTTMQSQFDAQFGQCITMGKQAVSAVELCQEQNSNEHEHTRGTVINAMSLRKGQSDVAHVRTREVTQEVGHDMLASIDSNTGMNQREHEATRTKMDQMRKEAQKQAEELREEIQNLKAEIQNLVKQVAAATTDKLTTKKQRMLQETTNAKFNLWVAKEIILKKLMDFLALFRLNFVNSWSSSLDTQWWKLEPYPKAGNPTSDQTIADSSGEAQQPVTLSSSDRLAYENVNLWYPIAAGNIPMIKMCLENGSNVNAFCTPDFELGMRTQQSRVPPLIAAICRTYEQRQEIVELLLEYGADPGGTDDKQMSAMRYALKTEDGELLKSMIKAFKERGYGYIWDLDQAVLDQDIGRVQGILSMPASYLDPMVATCPLQVSVIVGNIKLLEAFTPQNWPFVKFPSQSPSPLSLALKKGSFEMLGPLLGLNDSWYDEMFLITSSLRWDSRRPELLHHLSLPEVLIRVRNMRRTPWYTPITQHILSAILADSTCLNLFNVEEWRAFAFLAVYEWGEGAQVDMISLIKLMLRKFWQPLGPMMMDVVRIEMSRPRSASQFARRKELVSQFTKWKELVSHLEEARAEHNRRDEEDFNRLCKQLSISQASD